MERFFNLGDQDENREVQVAENTQPLSRENLYTSTRK
jgi:hypothetical protein